MRNNKIDKLNIDNKFIIEEFYKIMGKITKLERNEDKLFLNDIITVKQDKHDRFHLPESCLEDFKINSIPHNTQIYLYSEKPFIPYQALYISKDENNKDFIDVWFFSNLEDEQYTTGDMAYQLLNLEKQKWSLIRNQYYDPDTLYYINKDDKFTGLPEYGFSVKANTIKQALRIARKVNSKIEKRFIEILKQAKSLIEGRVITGIGSIFIGLFS